MGHLFKSPPSCQSHVMSLRFDVLGCCQGLQMGLYAGNVKHVMFLSSYDDKTTVFKCTFTVS